MTDAPTEILHATHRALCEHGYAELTMQDIADETDLSKASIHYHYDCKHDLLLAFLDHLYERFEERIADPSGTTPEAKLRSLVDSIVTRQSDAPAFQTALLEIKAQSPYDDAFRERLRRFDDTFGAAVRTTVEEGIEDGSFRDDLDPDTVASFLTTFVNGVQTRHVGAGHPVEESTAALDAYIDEMVCCESDPGDDSGASNTEQTDSGGAAE
ncbi:TetR/AcrR family transcriptional regulator [Halobellus ordinarius]|uniref:TetR/AcrR family transcriptional regulator n=1 Tax=Halobellus ordinarius TaxID=3075120 RepID=UPI0028801454|nr:TetR/AcrR family transcriptional regulator [Halobellus sp. ZY16]